VKIALKNLEKYVQKVVNMPGANKEKTPSTLIVDKLRVEI
jgi:hypothetical protein